MVWTDKEYFLSIYSSKIPFVSQNMGKSTFLHEKNEVKIIFGKVKLSKFSLISTYAA